MSDGEDEEFAHGPNAEIPRNPRKAVRRRARQKYDDTEDVDEPDGNDLGPRDHAGIIPALGSLARSRTNLLN